MKRKYLEKELLNKINCNIFVNEMRDDYNITLEIG